MKPRFGRRLLWIAALELYAVLAILILTGALLAFGSYARSVVAQENMTLAQIATSIGALPKRTDLEDVGDRIAARYLSPGINVLLIEGARRVVVYRAHRTDALPIVTQYAHRVAPAEPRAEGPLAAPLLGLAFAFGVQAVHGRAGDVDVIVRPAEPAIVATASAFVLPLALGLAFAALVALVLARALVRQTVRPLLDVQRALERFAAGDLTPQTIPADARQDFGALAVAYNGAIAQMERAFAERERATAAIRQFSADAGHQLRTPLTVMRGFIAILRKGDLRTPADRERILETMARQSQVMASLIDKLMLLDRWERDAVAVPQMIDVAQLVSDVVSPLAEAQPARAIRIDAPPGPLAKIDPTDLMHAVTNLVDNALKYTAGEIAVCVSADAGTVVVEVADAGPGMDENELRFAFDRFYRGARRDVDGSGLGLAIAKRAIERAGGTIAVASDRAAGTTVTIRLPRVARPLETAAVA